MHLKLSHRFDAPGCLEVTHISHNVTDSKLNFRAECVQATSPLVFLLAFDLFANATEVTLTKESVGTYILRVTKSQPEIWPDIFADYSIRNNFKTRIWFELEDKYPDDMGQFLSKMEKYVEQKKADAKKRERAERKVEDKGEVCAFQMRADLAKSYFLRQSPLK